MTAGVLYILTGPTAVGKTELALRWAESNRAEIVSCDSLLFYRGMDIGTAKPSADEQVRVRHHLIDICEVNERVNVMDYVARAKAAALDIHARGRSVLVTGGSGFYLSAFFRPVGDNVAVSDELRAHVATRLATEGLATLVEDLRGLNPEGLGALDLANPRRVLRALERCRASGRTLAALAEDFAHLPGPFADWNVHLTRLDASPVDLAGRIEQRVHAMLSRGLVAEVKGLLERGLLTNPSAARAIGYRETIAALRGELPLAQLEAEIIQNTRQLVKKQRTWFRTQLPPHTVIDTSNVRSGNLFG